MKDKNHMIILVNAKNIFDKVHHSFVIKNSQQNRKREESDQPDKKKKYFFKAYS